VNRFHGFVVPLPDVSGKATLRIKRKYQYRHWGWREEPQRKTIDSIEQSFPVTITILILSSTSLFRYKYIEGFALPLTGLPKVYLKNEIQNNVHRLCNNKNTFILFMLLLNLTITG
jgi:hypothetical protein